MAIIGIVTGGTAAGAGCAPSRAVSGGHGGPIGVFTQLKFCATWPPTWTSVVLSLMIGAGIGRSIVLLSGVGAEAVIPLIAVGMVGVLAATTQWPITAFAFVLAPKKLFLLDVHE